MRISDWSSDVYSSDLLESAGDGLCLLQQLQGPIAPPSGANPDFAVFIIADQVLQHAPRLNVGGEGFDFLGLHLPHVAVGKRLLVQLDGLDGHFSLLSAKPLPAACGSAPLAKRGKGRGEQNRWAWCGRPVSGGRGDRQRVG